MFDHGKRTTCYVCRNDASMIMVVNHPGERGGQRESVIGFIGAVLKHE
jgi:hypothetical protein